MSSVGTSDGAANSESAFGEVQSVAHRSTNSVIGEPGDPGGVHPSLKDEVFDQSSDVVVRERGDESGAVSEAAAEAAGDVVFAAAFPDLERARRADASITRIESKHHFAQRDDVVPARLPRPDLHRSFSAQMATASAASRSTSSNRRLVMAAVGVIQLPATAATESIARYSDAVAAVTPPVGTKRTFGKGPESALTVCGPPRASAGKSLRTVRP